MTPPHAECHNKPDEQIGWTLESLISLAGFYFSITLVACEHPKPFSGFVAGEVVQRPCIGPCKG